MQSETEITLLEKKRALQKIRDIGLEIVDEYVVNRMTRSILNVRTRDRRGDMHTFAVSVLMREPADNRRVTVVLETWV